MKAVAKKIFALVLGFVLIVGCLAPTQVVEAKSLYMSKKYAKSMKVQEKAWYELNVDKIENRKKGDKIIKRKSSNTSIIQFNAYMVNTFYAKKAGKATLTFTVKKKNGKIKKYTSKVRVVKTKKPRNLTFGGEEEVKYSKNLTVSLGKDNNANRYTIRDTPGGTIKKVSSSNKKVLVPYKGDGWGLNFKVKKPGTVKLTYTDYKNKKRTCKVKVVKYKNPVKSFKLGSRNLTSKFKKGTYYIYVPKSKKEKAKISIKPASGWKVKKIWNTGKTIKNNKRYTISKGKSTVIKVAMYHPKTKLTENLEIALDWLQ